VEVAEHKKRRFLRLVKARAHYRDVIRDETRAPQIVEAAKRVVALNLPSNLHRAAAVFVEYLFGWGYRRTSFVPPSWVWSKKLLPENERSSLTYSHFQDLNDVQIGDRVVLNRDVLSNKLTAAMAGVIREFLPNEYGEDELFIEFGEPEDCVTVKVRVPRSWLCTHRLGDP
jgi:hypothetical protein